MSISNEQGAPRAFMVRGGRDGEREERSLRENVSIIGWKEMGDLGRCPTWAALTEELQRVYPDRGHALIGNWTGQLWKFSTEIEEGHLIVMPLKTRPGRVAIGRVAGPYEYHADEPPGFRHMRKVEWIRTDLDRDAVKPDLATSLKSRLTICRLNRHDAARRIARLAEHGTDPGLDGEDIATRADALIADAASREPGDPRRLTVLDLLDHWNFQRRTSAAVEIVRSALAENGLTTRPPFTEGPIEREVALVPLGAEPGTGAEAAEDAAGTEAVSDPQPMTLRLGALPAPLVSVPSAADLTYAKTLMLQREFSQLAVIDEDGRYHGAVSWESIGRAHIAHAEPTLADATAPALVVDHDALLLEQIPVIYERGFVFVRDADRMRVTGIVTAADLTRQFGELARPFVLIEEAENRLRRAAAETYTVEELRATTKNKNRRERIHSASDLTFGSYTFLLDDDARWAKLGWSIDRGTLLRLLDEVRKVRNDLMHFSPDPLSADRRESVRQLLTLLRTVDPRP